MKNLIPSSTCACGSVKTASHQLIQCPLYQDDRQRYLSNLSCALTVNTLLFRNDRLSFLTNRDLFWAFSAISQQQSVLMPNALTPGIPSAWFTGTVHDIIHNKSYCPYRFYFLFKYHSAELLYKLHVKTSNHADRLQSYSCTLSQYGKRFNINIYCLFLHPIYDVY